ncbi:MAG: hypothetical protein NTY64_24450 [Deltaproteobacteria bacterium]|nr:hypothetical protein [Deltaproteobacteria bacterium]
MGFILFTLLLLPLSFLGCAPSLPKEPLRPRIVWQEQEITPPLFDDGEKISLLQALNRSLDYWEKVKSSREYYREWPGPEGRVLTPEIIFNSLTLFREILANTPDPKEWDRQIREGFTFWQVKRWKRIGEENS